MRKALPLIALLLALCLGLGGCALRGQEKEAAGEISLPQPADEPENMILGESASGGMVEVALYHPASDFSGFSTVNQGLHVEVGQSLPEAAVEALLGSGIRAAADVRLLSCEFSCDTVTVNLSIDARNANSPQELLALQTAIGNTVLGIDGVRAANVLIADRSEGCCQLPVGVQTEIVPSVTAAYAQLQAESARLNQAGAAPIERTALLYFPTEGGEWLVPELRSLTVSDGAFAPALLDALKAGPADERCAIASIPEGAELLEDAPAVETLSTGERVLTLNFTSALANYLAFSGLEVWELAGSITMTMTSFLPELDGVKLMVNSEPITMCAIGETILQFRDGLMRRRDFADRVGSVATLYLLNEGDWLQGVERAVSMRSALSPKRLLTELFAFSGIENAPYRLPIPAVVYAEDLLGVQVSGGIARVNLSANFYRSCQTLSPRAERDLVYAMVNTLCTLDGVRAVRFYVEGRAADTLAGSVYLRSPLLPNPGLVAAPGGAPTPTAEP